MTQKDHSLFTNIETVVMALVSEAIYIMSNNVAI